MLGWRIVVHSMLQVTGNLGAAVRVSIPLVAVFVVEFLLLPTPTVITTDPLGEMAAYSAWMVPFLIAWIICGLWLAVAWHRFILLEENPGAVLPPYHGGLMLSYFGRSILLALVAIGVGLLLGLLIGFIALPLVGQSPMMILIVMGAFVYVPVSWIFYRQSLILPAAALGQPFPLGQSWNKTEPFSGAIFSAVVILIGIYVVLAFVEGLIYKIGGIPGAIFTAASQWFMTIFGVSVLTTLYGHIEEERPLVV